MLQRILILTFLGLILVIVAFHDPDATPRLKAVTFHVTEGNALYFRNLRQFYYHKEERKDARFEVFRFQARPADSIRADMRFAIVSNWLHDEAYIMAEANEMAIHNDSVRLKVNSDGQSQFRSLSNNNMEEHLSFALFCYEHLGDPQASFYIMGAKGWEPLWSHSEERNGVKRVLKDYLKLVAAIH